MKVREIMTTPTESCVVGTDLADAAMIMWRNDCGVVPVVTEHNGQALGVVTDRDICMAVATRHCRAEEIRVGDVISGRLVSIGPDEEIGAALDLMRLEQVRRLPVVGPDDTLFGMVSMNDMIRHCIADKGRRHTSLSPEAVVRALKGICDHRAGALVAERDIAALITGSFEVQTG
jgi:CBS domain-containing protein